MAGPLCVLIGVFNSGHGKPETAAPQAAEVPALAVSARKTNGTAAGCRDLPSLIMRIMQISELILALVRRLGGKAVPQ